MPALTPKTREFTSTTCGLIWSLAIEHCIFSNLHTPSLDGGAIHFKTLFEKSNPGSCEIPFKIQNNVFHDLSANLGGAIYIDAQTNDKLISSNSFKLCFANKGRSIYFDYTGSYTKLKSIISESAFSFCGSFEKDSIQNSVISSSLGYDHVSSSYEIGYNNFSYHQETNKVGFGYACVISLNVVQASIQINFCNFEHMINSNLIFLHNEKSVSKISKCKFNNISNVNQPLIYLTNDNTVFDNNCIFACKHPASWLVVENQMKRMTNKPFHNFGHILVPRKLKKCASETKFDKIKQEKSIEQSSTVSSSMKMITKLLLTSFTQFSLYIKLAKRASLSSGKTFSPQKLLGKNYAFNNVDSTIFLPKLAPKADSDSGSSKSAFDWHCIVLIILSIIIIVIIVLIVLLFLKIKGGGGGGRLHPNDDRASVNTGLNDQGLTGIVPDDVADVIPF